MIGIKEVKELRESFFILTTKDNQQILITTFKTKIEAEGFVKKNKLPLVDTAVCKGEYIESIALEFFWGAIEGESGHWSDLVWKTQKEWLEENPVEEEV